MVDSGREVVKRSERGKTKSTRPNINRVLSRPRRADNVTPNLLHPLDSVALSRPYTCFHLNNTEKHPFFANWWNIQDDNTICEVVIVTLTSLVDCDGTVV